MGMVCIAPKLHLSQLNCLRSNYCNKGTVLFCCNYSVPLPCCPRDLPMSAVSRGEGGQLGHADSNDRQVPVMITPDRFANKSVLMAACGGLHTVRCHEWACEFCTQSLAHFSHVHSNQTLFISGLPLCSGSLNFLYSMF